MTDNGDELHMFETGDNIGAQFFPTGDDPNPQDSQLPTSQSPQQDHRVEDVCLDENFVTDHLGPNDCLSDETHFEQQIVESNENSNHPSPVKGGPTAGTDVGVDSNQSLSAANAPPIYPTSTLLNDSPRLRSGGTRESEIDIATFIDKFLGDDDIMHNAPEIPDGMKMERVASIPCSNITDKINKTNNALGARVSTGLGLNRTTTTDSAFMMQQTVPSQLLGKEGLSQERNSVKVPVNTDLEISGQGIQGLATRAHWPPLQGMASSTQVPVRRSEKRKPRTYSQAIPSQHCHICSRRPTEGSPHQVCGNLQKGRCRKTICTKCFHQFRWDLNAARQAPPGTWECPHCRGQCPQRAQCVIYNRTSDRRRLKLINHRKRKSEDNASNDKTGCPAKKQTLAKSNSPNSGKTMRPSVPSLNNDKSCATSGTGAKARNAALHSKKASASMLSKKSTKSQQVRKDSSRKEQSTRTLEEHNEINGKGLSRAMPSGYRAKVEQQCRPLVTLDSARMTEKAQSQMLLENNFRTLQGHLYPVFTPTNGMEQAYAAYSMMKQGSPLRDQLSRTPVQPNESSLNTFSAGVPPSSSLANGIYHPIPQGDGFLSVGMNAALVQTEPNLGQQQDNSSQHSELVGRIQEGALLIEDIWPKATAVQHEFDVATSEETPEDFWILPEGPSDSISDDQKENGVNLLDPEGAQMTSRFSVDRLGYHGASGFEEKEPLIA